MSSVRVGFLTVGHFTVYAKSARRQLLPFYVNFSLVAFTDLPAAQAEGEGGDGNAECREGPHGHDSGGAHTELKEELTAREEAVSGNKAWLRRRLHAAIVRKYLEASE